MTGNARYRSPHRLPALLLMAALSAALLLAAVLGYPALRRGYLTAHAVPIGTAGARPIAVSAEQAARYHLLSAAELIDQNGAADGYLLVTERQGYKSRIRVQSTFSADGTLLSGIRVLEQNETEYLGVRVATEGFTAQFSGRLAPMRLWTVPMLGSPIDGLSGSTVSSQAVVDAVNDAWRFILDIRSVSFR